MDFIITPQTPLSSLKEGSAQSKGKYGKTMDNIFSAQSKKRNFLDLLTLLRANKVVTAFHDIDLSNVDLNNVDLSYIDLTGANLTNANLSGANLTGVNLTGAKINRTILTHATLTNVVLTNVAIDKVTKLAWQQALNQQWYEKAQKTIKGFNQAWEALQAETGFNAFEMMLKQMHEWHLKECVTVDEIVEILDVVIASADIRYLVFEAAQGAIISCHDHLLCTFTTVQGLIRFGKLMQTKTAQQELIVLAVSIVKQNLLDDATLPLMRKQWIEGRRESNRSGTGPNVSGALAMQLALQHQLAVQIGLPFSLKKSTQEEVTSMTELSDSDKKFAMDFVNKYSNDKEQLTEALMALPVWQLYLQRLLSKKSEKIAQSTGACAESAQVAIDDLFRRETGAMLDAVAMMDLVLES